MLHIIVILSTFELIALFSYRAVARPSNTIFATPDESGLYATRNFYVSHRDPDGDHDIQIGVWHVLPNYIAKKFSKELNLSEVHNI